MSTLSGEDPKSGSRLEAVLASGAFAVTAELGPPKSADADAVTRKAALLAGAVDAANITDNQTAIVRMSSIAAGLIAARAGLEPVIQITCRDRNRIAIQSDVLGASALGLKNILCLTGDHQKFGNHPGSKNVYDMATLRDTGDKVVTHPTNLPGPIIPVNIHPGATDDQRLVVGSLPPPPAAILYEAASH